MDSSEKNNSDASHTVTSEPSSSYSAVNQKLCKKYHLHFCAVHQDAISSVSSCFNTAESCDASDESHNDGKSSTDCVESDDRAPSKTLIGETPRRLRKKRKARCSQNCPVCGLTVRFQDMAEHFEFELRRLQSVKIRKMKKTEKRISSRQKRFQGVIERRTSRQRIIHTSGTTTNTCPICVPRIGAFDTLAVIMNQFADCFGVDDLLRSVLFEGQRQNSEGYTFGAEERVRIIDLMQADNDVVNVPYDRIQNADESVVVVVDSDEDNAAYGPSQFTEYDLCPCESSLSDADRSALREAVIRSSVKSTLKSGTDPAENDLEAKNLCEIDGEAVGSRRVNAEISDDDDDDDNRNATEMIPKKNLSPESIIICALKSKIDELENGMQNNSAKCNICLDDYRVPLVSITCWHVACKTCWMRTLGEKKLCPRCTKITLPSDLRRVYM